jgi:hypothetical protein
LNDLSRDVTRYYLTKEKYKNPPFSAAGAGGYSAVRCFALRKVSIMGLLIFKGTNFSLLCQIQPDIEHVEKIYVKQKLNIQSVMSTHLSIKYCLPPFGNFYNGSIRLYLHIDS